MEVRPGYKQTEVGVIPQEWGVLRLADAGKWRGGMTPSMQNASYWVGGDVPWISSGDVKVAHLTETSYSVTTEAVTQGRTTLMPARSIVLVVRSGILRKFLPVAMTMVPMAINQDIKALAPFPGYDADFLLHALIGAGPKILGSCLKSGTTVESIELSWLKAFALPLPPTEAEQRAIAAALSDVDALLDGLDRLIAKKRDLKQAAMQQLLTGRTRLPGFHAVWDAKRLGELAEIVSGGTPRTGEPSYWNGGIRWCTPTDITRYEGKYLTETERTISHAGLSNSGATLLPAGALLLCSRATIGEMKIAGTPICTNQGFKSLVCRPGVSNEFLYYKLMTMKQQMIERAFGSTFLEISTRNVSALEIATPPLDEQIAIAAVLSDMDTEQSALEARRDKTKALKQAMMQVLLTGTVRLI